MKLIMFANLLTHIHNKRLNKYGPRRAPRNWKEREKSKYSWFVNHLISQVVCIYQIPLTTAPLITPSIAFSREINPFRMAKLKKVLININEQMTIKYYPSVLIRVICMDISRLETNNPHGWSALHNDLQLQFCRQKDWNFAHTSLPMKLR